jgi:hypothetical protein
LKVNGDDVIDEISGISGIEENHENPQKTTIKMAGVPSKIRTGRLLKYKSTAAETRSVEWSPVGHFQLFHLQATPLPVHPVE